MRRFLLLVFLIHFSLRVDANQTDYPPISPDNVMNLQEVARLGYGRVDKTSFTWSPDGESLIAAADHDGLFYWESLSAEPEFINLGMTVYWPFFATERLIFFNSNGNLLAYDLLERRVLYEVSGMRALAVSHNGEMLGYEHVDGSLILEIVRGNLLYDFAYPLQFPEETNSDFGWSANDIFFAQFNPQDNALIVGWQDQVVAGRSFQRWVHTKVYTLDEPAATTIQGWYPEADRDANLLLYREDGSVFSANLDFMVGGVASRMNNDAPYDFAGHYLAVPNGILLDDWGYFSSITEIWDTRTGERVLSIEDYGALALSPDGSKIAIDNVIYAIPSGEILGYLQSDVYYLMRRIADRIIAFGYDDRVRFLDAASGAEVAVLPIEAHDWHLHQTDFSDGSLLLIKNDSREALRLNSVTGEIIAHFVSEMSAFQSVVISGDFGLMYSESAIRSSEYNGGWVNFETIWDFHTGEMLSLPPTYDYEFIAPYFSPNGSVILWERSTDSIHLYDVDEQKLISFPDTEHDGRSPYSVNISPDEHYILISEQDNLSFLSQLWSVDEQSLIVTLHPNSPLSAFSPDSTYLAYQSNDDSITVHSLTGETDHIIGITEWPYELEFSSNTVLLITSGADYGETYTAYDVQSGEETPYVPEWMLPQVFAETDTLSFAIDAGWLVISTEDGQFLQSFDPDYDSGIAFVTMSSDESRIYFGLHNGIIGIWAVGE